MTAATVRDRLAEGRVMAVLRVGADGGDPVALAQRVVAAGVTAVEYTMDSPDPLATIARLRAVLDPVVAVGAGTVTRTDQLGPLADAGATFVVSPHVDPALVEAASDRGLEPVPGVLSATEVRVAVGAGASILKLFPAGPMGVDYLRALRGPFAGVDWVPTGGIALGDVGGWLDAGALCVGIGSALWSTADPVVLGEALVRSSP